MAKPEHQLVSRREEELDRFFKKHRVQRKDLRQKCKDDKLFLALSRKLAYLDIELAILLTLERQEINEIKRDNLTEKERLVAMFWKWTERNGSDATYLSLIEALIQTNQGAVDIALDHFTRTMSSGERVNRGDVASRAPYFTQLSLPAGTTSRPSSYLSYNRSSSNPERSQKSDKVCAKKPNNDIWKVYDRYYDRVVIILQKNVTFWQKLIELLFQCYMITTTEKEIIEQLPSVGIKCKAIIGRVSSFISKGRNNISAFNKFFSCIQTFDGMEAICEEMKKEALEVCDVHIQARLPETKKSLLKETSTLLSGSVSDDHLILAASNEIKSYSRHLKIYYQKKLKPDSKWSPRDAPHNVYVDLAVLESDTKHSDPFSKSTIRGTVDDIARRKKPLSFEELCNIYYGANVLIEGAPGIGKSMLASEICSQWVRGEILKNYMLLFLLHLRDKQIQNMSTVQQLLGCFLGDQSWKEKAIQEIIDSSGEGVMIILEGFDELPDHLTKSDSIFFRLTKYLPFASYVFTSRPSAKHSLQNELKFDCHVEVLGFTKESIQKYIGMFFEGDDEQLEGFKQCLLESPKVEDSLYIPINLVIICSIFRQYFANKEPVPIQGAVTATKLYEALIKMLLYRYMKSKSPPEKKIFIPDLSKLPQQVLEKFKCLCAMAYDGIRSKDSKLVFYALDDFETLGLMQKEVHVLPGFGDAVGYSFLHLTIQEFLAAFHVSQMPTKKIQKHFNDFKHVHKLSTMLRFLAGLTNLKSVDLEVDKNYYSLSVFQFLFESGNESLLRQTFNKSHVTHKISRILPKPIPQDMYLLGRCIILSQCKWELGFTLRGLFPEHVDMFQQGLASVSSASSCQIQHLSLSLNPIGSLGIGYLLQFPDFILQQLLSLHLMSTGLDSSCVEEFVKHLPKLQRLYKLYLHNNRFNEGDQRPMLAVMASLKLQDVTFSKLSPEECSLVLTEFTSLNKIELHQLSSNSIETVMQCLPDAPSLQKLQIQQSLCTVANLHDLPQVLATSLHLTNLEFINCDINSSCVPVLVNAVLQSTLLKVLSLNDNFIDDVGGQNFCEMIQEISSYTSCNFRELAVGHNPFTEAGILAFIQTLSHIKPATQFVLSLSLGWESFVTKHDCYATAKRHLKFLQNEE